MGTRSAIGIEHQDGTVEAVYCHWDGYLSWNGKLLLDHYDREKTLKLIALGDLSTLRTELGEKHDFDDRSDETKDWCKFYSRDRDESDCESKKFRSVDAFLREFDAGAEYHYVLRTSGIWQVSAYRRALVDLFDALREEAEMEEEE
jgi:hypothetical protein